MITLPKIPKPQLPPDLAAALLAGQKKMAETGEKNAPVKVTDHTVKTVPGKTVSSSPWEKLGGQVADVTKKELPPNVMDPSKQLNPAKVLANAGKEAQTAGENIPGFGGQMAKHAGNATTDISQGKVGAAVAEGHKASALGGVTTGVADSGGKLASAGKAESENLSKTWKDSVTDPARATADKITAAVNPAAPAGAPGAGGPSATSAVGPAPAWQSSLNPDGTIKAPLSAAGHFSAAQASTAPTATASQGIAGAALTDRATQQGPSPWLNLQMAQQDRLTQDARNNAAGQIAGSTAAARTGIATHGGLSSGAMERVAKGGANAGIDANQNISNQDIQQRNLLGIADENTKTGLLGTAAGLEQGLSQFNAGQTNTMGNDNANRVTDVSKVNATGQNAATGFDINNALSDKGLGFGAGLDAWKTKMTGAAANDTASAIARGGAGGNKGG